ncbi:MAG: TonB-dependent receptor [Gammaproteobacteria bacterium]|nr:TonB-dependent receptor [Gammaproteobacteria bacterium]
MKSRTMSFFNRTVVTCLIAAVGLVPGLVQAQLEEIVVTAQKREQSLQEVPVSVTALSTEQLKNNQFKDITQILVLTPSVNYTRGFNTAATNFNIRGLGTFAFVAGLQPGVALSVDGVPRARNGEFTFDLADIEGIEVLRGPQGTLFGRGSTGGAINITTAGPTEEFEAELEAGAADDDEYFVRGVVSGPLSDNIRGRIAAMYLDHGGYQENFNPGVRDQSGQENVALRGKLDIDVTDDVTLRLGFDYNDNDHSTGPLTDQNTTFQRFGGAQVDTFLSLFSFPLNSKQVVLGNGDPVLGQEILDDPFKVNQNDHDNNNTLWGISADITWDINESLRLRSITAYREFQMDIINDTDTSNSNWDNLGVYPLVALSSNHFPGSPIHGFQVDMDYIQTEFRLEHSTDRYEALVGVFYQDLEERASSGRAYLADVSLPSFFGGLFGSFFPASGAGTFATPGQVYTCFVCDSYDSVAGQETIAVFGDITFHATDRLDVFAGFRYTEEDATKTLDNSFFAGTATGAQVGASPIFDLNSLIGTTIFQNDPPAGNGSAGDSFDFWSFRAGASFGFTDEVSAYASFSRGFVGPGFPLTQADVIVPTGDQEVFLPPTEADNYEIGLKSELFDRRLRLNMALYQMDVTDLQTQVTLPGTITPISLSSGGLDVTGFELDAIFQATDWLTLSAGVAYTDAEVSDLTWSCFTDQITSGVTVPGSGCVLDLAPPAGPETQDIDGVQTVATPEWAYNLNAAFNIPSNSWPVNFYGSINWSWRDDMNYSLDQDDFNVQDSYGLLDLTFGVRDKKERWEAYVYGKNVADKFYHNYSFAAPTFIARHSLITPRNAQAYFGGGVKLFF